MHDDTPYTPLLYSRTGLQGYSFFIIFALKHRLWVLTIVYPQSMF